MYVLGISDQDGEFVKASTLTSVLAFRPFPQMIMSWGRMFIFIIGYLNIPCFPVWAYLNRTDGCVTLSCSCLATFIPVPVPGKNASEIKMFHQEDAGLNVEMAKLAFAKGIWSYVLRMERALRAYSASSCLQTHTSASSITLIQKV